MVEPTDRLEFHGRDQWRSWLEANHARAGEAWLVLCKKAYREGALALSEAVEEALCYGWIDSTLRPIDERRYALRFSPRRPNSIWSETNKRRVRRLIRGGRMTPAGLAAVAEARESGQWEAASRREQVDLIPPELDQALGAHEGARDAYLALPPSRRKQLIYWITSARRPDTRRGRIEAILEEVIGSPDRPAGG